MKLTYKLVKKSDKIRKYVEQQDGPLHALGYTEHSLSHVQSVSNVAAEILATLGYSNEDIELVKIAGYMHDLGNLINRVDHSKSGALMTFQLLEELGGDPYQIAQIITAIGNHDETDGLPVSPITAALILADKSDIRRSRVRTTDPELFDIHDRVNYAVESVSTSISDDRKSFILNLKIDTNISTVIEYFNIFMKRMLLCENSAKVLGLKFKLIINGQELS